MQGLIHRGGSVFCTVMDEKWVSNFFQLVSSLNVEASIFLTYGINTTKLPLL
jgi:hypothetical protein